MFCIITFDLYSFGKMNNMTEQPLLTIAIPTYNGSATIRVMMDILMPQCDSRVEIIVSDNCSMDTTPEIIKYYKEKYPFIKYVRNQINIGADANFLQCMRLATGKYIYLLSDDDVLMEGALSYILDYLARYPDVGLVYLNSMGFHGRYEGLERCSKLAYAEEPKEDLYTEDKTLFMNCAARFWGFMSSFIVLNKNFKKIEKPEQYFGTYWLQSYIHILCCSAPHSKVGVIKKPCMAAGIYMDVNNFDNSIVNGVNYKAMVDFAVNIGGFDKHQMKRLYIWRLIYLSSHAIIKEKAAGVKKTSYWRLFKISYMYPMAWLKLYPTYVFPKWLCRMGMKYYRNKKKLSDQVKLSREGDVKS